MDIKEIKAGDVVYLNSDKSKRFTVGHPTGAVVDCYHYDVTTCKITKSTDIPIAALTKTEAD